MNPDISLLPVVEIKAPSTKYAVIWLHGLGADGHDFVPILPELDLAETRFIFPHAPIMPITLNNGMKMRAWFDISSLSRDASIDRVGIAEAIHAIEKLILNEIARGIAAENIMLAGFSQGAVIALCTGLGFSQTLGGVIALSGYLPRSSSFLDKTHAANTQLPIFMAHGTEDPIVAYTFGHETYLALQAAGFPVSWHSYPITHTVSTPEIKDIRKWVLLARQSKIKDKPTL